MTQQATRGARAARRRAPARAARGRRTAAQARARPEGARRARGQRRGAADPARARRRRAPPGRAAAAHRHRARRRATRRPRRSSSTRRSRTAREEAARRLGRELDLAVERFAREAEGVLTERLNHVSDAAAKRVEERLARLRAGLERQRDDALQSLEERAHQVEAEPARAAARRSPPTPRRSASVLEARLQDLARRVEEIDRPRSGSDVPTFRGRVRLGQSEKACTPWHRRSNTHQSEREKVESWRLHVLIEAGYPAAARREARALRSRPAPRGRARPRRLQRSRPPPRSCSRTGRRLASTCVKVEATEVDGRKVYSVRAFNQGVATLAEAPADALGRGRGDRAAPAGALGVGLLHAQGSGGRRLPRGADAARAVRRAAARASPTASACTSSGAPSCTSSAASSA